jgi:preprotein translocase subunit SecA
MSRFYLSLEDNLMRIFASERVKNFMQALGMEKGEAIEHRMVTNAIEKAQRKVEGRNFDIRKQLLEYDDVANDQRQIIYSSATTCSARRTSPRPSRPSPGRGQRGHRWLHPAHERRGAVGRARPGAAAGGGLRHQAALQQWLEEDDKLHEEAIRERIVAEVQSAYDAKADTVGPDMRRIEKQIMLQVLDTLWKEHLATMDHLRQGIHLRAYAQKNPKQEYKRESFELFQPC